MEAMVTPAPRSMAVLELPALLKVAVLPVPGTGLGSEDQLDSVAQVASVVSFQTASSAAAWWADVRTKG
jgi:hypothetical protein